MTDNNSPCGILVLNKGAAMTSHDAVNRIRRLYGTRQVGHTGTLDPMATGVLVILVGRAAKAAEYLEADEKEYIAQLQLGLTTDTQDITGIILSLCNDIPEEEAVLNALSSFRGEILQVPPMYSALKVGGRKLYELARQGVVVERAARPINISRLEARRIDTRNYSLEITCSKGTYIRALCHDIGQELMCGGVMAALRRTRAGAFKIADAIALESLEAMTPDERIEILQPLEALFDDLPIAFIPIEAEKYARSGGAVELCRTGLNLTDGTNDSTRVRMCDSIGFFALGEIRGEYVKAIKMFDIS